MTNTAKQLNEKFNFPEYRDVTTESRSAMLEGDWQRTYLNRDIAALMTLALEHKIDIYINSDDVIVGYPKNDDYKSNDENYSNHPTKLDALCEALCQALLAE